MGQARKIGIDSANDCSKNKVRIYEKGEEWRIKKLKRIERTERIDLRGRMYGAYSRDSSRISRDATVLGFHTFMNFQ